MMRAYYIPNGPRNLSPVFFPSIDFNNVDKYYLEIKDELGNTIATTTINELDGECCSDKVRVHFLNYLGTIDAINFKLLLEEHETSSDIQQKSNVYPLVKDIHGQSRFNVRAKDTLTLVNVDYREEDMKWVKELFDSPLIWVEWTGIQNQADSYIPYKIIDSKSQTVKREDRYIYEIEIQIEPSHEQIIIRS